jgi:hypothetical protein
LAVISKQLAEIFCLPIIFTFANASVDAFGDKQPLFVYLHPFVKLYYCNYCANSIRRQHGVYSLGWNCFHENNEIMPTESNAS